MPRYPAHVINMALTYSAPLSKPGRLNPSGKFNILIEFSSITRQVNGIFAEKAPVEPPFSLSTMCAWAR
jgi:hypothetical protein